MTFWSDKPLEQLTHQEWESLCDGCGKCCVHKLEDDDTEQIYYTDVACKQLDISSAQCHDYDNRLTEVPNCLDLSPDNIHDLAPILPDSCAYRQLANGEALADWHPLVTGKPLDTDRSVKYRVVSEQGLSEEDIEERIVVWL